MPIKRSLVLLWACAALAPFTCARPAAAASSNPTATASLLRANGSGEAVASGDWVTDRNAPALNNSYRFFIEVPPGLGSLVVEVFDPDIGRGGNNEGTRDLLTGNNFNTAVIYSLFRPDGVRQGGSVTCSNANTPAVCVDNAWSALFGTVQDPQAGHWELRVDPSNANGQNGDETMGYGVRAHDGNAGAGGVEIPVYADSYLGLGPTTQTQQVNVFHPWVTSGCTARSNDFDADTAAGTNYTLAGNVAFSQQFTAVSGNGVWRSNATGAYTSDNTAQNYGIWTDTVDVRKAGNAAANVITYYVASQLAAVAGTGNPANPRNQPEPGTFRLYLPTDAGGVPVKPFVEQFARGKSGANPPVAGQLSTITITVRVTNPTTRPIVFSGANTVSSTVPAGTRFAGNIAATQGTTTSPAVGGAGPVSWNPGTLAAGATALLAYDVDVTPANPGRVVVTGPTANGTTARYVDETGNTTQGRATFTFGPLCELAVNVGTLTYASVADVHAVRSADGSVDVAWRTAGEAGTAGFSVIRVAGDDVTRVGDVPSPRLPQGARYAVHDDGAREFSGDITGDVGDGELSYLIVEHDDRGGERVNGPFLLDDGDGDGDDDTAPPLLVPPPAIHALANGDANGVGAVARTSDAPPTAGVIGIPVAARVVVAQEGLVVIPLAQLAGALGRPAAEVRRIGDAGGLRVDSDGVVVGSDVRDGFLVFYARATDSPFARGRTYFVRVGGGAEGAGVVDGSGAAFGVNLATATPTITAAPVTTVFGEDVSPGSATDLDPNADLWVWAALAAGYPDADHFDTSVDVEMGDGGADVTFVLQGATHLLAVDDHRVRLRVNGEVVDDFAFTGLARVKRTVHVPPTAALPLALGVDAVEYVDADHDDHDDTGRDVLRNSAMFVDSIRVQTARALDASTPRSFALAAGDVVGVAGAASASALWMYRVDAAARGGDAVALTRVEGGVVAGGAFRALVPDDGRYAYAAAGVPSRGLALSPVGASTIASNRGADVVVIAPRALWDAAQELAAWHLSRGHTSRVVDVQDIFDAWVGGDRDPRAVQRFIADIRARWDARPRYAVLLGDGDTDYRDVLGLHANFVPPMLRTTGGEGVAAADALVGDVDGDGLAEVAVGRIPARSADDVRRYIAAAEQFEGPATAVFLADMTDADSGADFGAITADLAAQVALPSQRLVLEGPDIDAVRAAFFDAVHRGDLVTFVGHGGMDRLGEYAGIGMVTTAHEALLQSKGPFALVALTCIVNRFELADIQGLGEELARNGAAPLVFAPSGKSDDVFAAAFGAHFFDRLAQGGDIGDIIVDAEHNFAAHGGAPAQFASFVLLGDPTLHIAPQPSASASSCASVGAGGAGVLGAALALAFAFARRRRR